MTLENIIDGYYLGVLVVGGLVYLFISWKKNESKSI